MLVNNSIERKRGLLGSRKSVTDCKNFFYQERKEKGRKGYSNLSKVEKCFVSFYINVSYYYRIVSWTSHSKEQLIWH